MYTYGMMPSRFPAADPNAGPSPMMPAPVVKPPAPAPHPMGFMGRIRQVLTPDRLRVIGAGLHDLSTGGNSLPDLLAQLDQQRNELEQQRWRRIQQDQAVLGWKQDQQQHETEAAQAAAAQQQMEELIASLPPNQQALARLNAPAYVAGIMRNRYPAPPRARSAGSMPALPDGFQWED